MNKKLPLVKDFVNLKNKINREKSNVLMYIDDHDREYIEIEPQSIDEDIQEYINENNFLGYGYKIFIYRLPRGRRIINSSDNEDGLVGHPEVNEYKNNTITLENINKKNKLLINKNKNGYIVDVISNKYKNVGFIIFDLR